MADRGSASQRSYVRGVVSAVLALSLLSGAEAAAETERSVSASGLGGLLSSPLPGTRARETADLTGRLEQVLAGFEGVDAAAVIVTGASDAIPPSLHVAIQVTLSDGFVATVAWLDALRIFSLRTIPHLDEDSLTIVDSAGRVLLDAGAVHLRASPASPPDIGVIDETFRFEPWWLWAAAGIGFVLVVAGVSTQWVLRRDDDAVVPAADPGPLDFLESVSGERLAEMLAGERPEVVGAVVALAPASLAERLRRLDGLSVDPAADCRPPDAVMTAALAEALAERLARA